MTLHSTAVNALALELQGEADLPSRSSNMAPVRDDCRLNQPPANSLSHTEVQSRYLP